MEVTIGLLFIYKQLIFLQIHSGSLIVRILIGFRGHNSFRDYNIGLSPILTTI